MQDLLRQIASETPNTNPYIGSARARKLRARFEQSSPGMPPDPRLLLELGGTELLLGNLEVAIDHLGRATVGLRGTDPVLEARAAFHLGVGFLRLGETQNCCRLNNPESCVVPIRGGGLHTRPEGSRGAIEALLQAYELAEDDALGRWGARWLINIAHMTLGTYPEGVPEPLCIPTQAFRSKVRFPEFRNVAKKMGLDAFNLAGGAVVDDLDGDDDLDIVTTTWDPNGRMHCYRNQGDGTFVDVSDHAGLTGILGGLNMEPADYDNDGDLDLLVLRGAWIARWGRHPNSLLRNDGRGRFTDVTFEAGLGAVHYPTQAAGWADYDNDGDLDVFVGNETSPQLRAPSQLFRNNGDGTFTDVARAAGVETLRWVKGVAWGDYDGDRDPDLYVSCYRGYNCLYRNNGDGTFTDVAIAKGVHGPVGSFPVWFWDFDNDGALDLFVPSYTGTIANVASYYAGGDVPYERPCLYRGSAAGVFREVAREQGLDYPMLPMGCNYGDLDNDGYLDFYLGTGDTFYETLVPNLLFRNRGGSGFDDVTMASRMGHLQKGHSVCFADLDGDGDLDIFEQMGGAYPGDEFSDALYENPGFGNRSITLQLVGTRSNRSAIGARIRVLVRDGETVRSIYRTVSTGGSFGANPLRQTIGLGARGVIERIEIFWPTTGRTEVVRGLAPGQAVEITEGRPGWRPLAVKSVTLGG